MSEESLAADANLREIARLNVELRLLRNRPAVVSELAERGAEMLLALAEAPADLVDPSSAAATIRAVLGEVARLRGDASASRFSKVELLEEIQHRAEIDAEDTQRLRAYYESKLSKLRATIARAAEYLPGRPYVAERVLSEVEK